MTEQEDYETDGKERVSVRFECARISDLSWSLRFLLTDYRDLIYPADIVHIFFVLLAAVTQIKASGSILQHGFFNTGFFYGGIRDAAVFRISAAREEEKICVDFGDEVFGIGSDVGYGVKQ